MARSAVIDHHLCTGAKMWDSGLLREHRTGLALWSLLLIPVLINYNWGRGSHWIVCSTIKLLVLCAICRRISMFELIRWCRQSSLPRLQSSPLLWKPLLLITIVRWYGRRLHSLILRLSLLRWQGWRLMVAISIETTILFLWTCLKWKCSYHLGVSLFI